MGTNDPTPEQREQQEVERLDDLLKAAQKLCGRAQERLERADDTMNVHRLKSMGMDVRSLLDAAVAVLHRL